MIIIDDMTVEELRRVRSAAVTFLQALDRVNLDGAPEKPRERQDLKQERIDNFDRMYSTGKIRKPKDLKRRNKK